MNRRSTLAAAARGGVGPPIHSVYGADDALRHDQTPTLQDQQEGNTTNERGSLPNLDELANQPLNMPREEVGILSTEL